jgi:ATP-dependent HslUV protease ATP-binding subunit HslU
MIRDLTVLAINMVRKEEQELVREKAERQAEEKILDLLLPTISPQSAGAAPEQDANIITLPYGEDLHGSSDAGREQPPLSTRERFRQMLREGKLNERTVELAMPEQGGAPMVEIFSASGMEDMQSSMQDAFSKFFPRKKKKRKVRVAEAFEQLKRDEAEQLVDMEKVTERAIRRTEQTGIIFLDEIDKITSRGGTTGGPDVSREGVQRDLLPIVEGATVTTKYGPVRTDHILFIASGAFHMSKPSDLVPELQGRFPIRVELHALGEEEFFRILTEPQNALIKQYVALLATEGVELVFEDEAIREMARIAVAVNRMTEDIGARRLHTILERVLDEVSFGAPEMEEKRFVITAAYVKQQLADISANEDLSRFIL